MGQRQSASKSKCELPSAVDQAALTGPLLTMKMETKTLSTCWTDLQHGGLGRAGSRGVPAEERVRHLVLHHGAGGEVDAMEGQWSSSKQFIHSKAGQE